MKCVASTHTHTRTRIVLTFSFIETANVRWTKHTKPRFWIVITSAPMFYWNMRFEVKQMGTQNERPRHDENGSKDGKNTYRLKGNLHHLTIQRTHFIFIKAIQLTGHLPPYHPYHCLFNSITFVRKTIKYKSIRLNRNKSFSFCGDLSFICTKEMKKKNQQRAYNLDDVYRVAMYRYAQMATMMILDCLYSVFHSIHSESKCHCNRVLNCFLFN